LGGAAGAGGQGGVDGFDPQKAANDPNYTPVIHPDGTNGATGATGGVGSAGADGVAATPTCTICHAETIPPTITLTAPTATFSTLQRLAVAWKAADTQNTVTVAVRYRTAPAGAATGLSGYVYPSTWQSLSILSLTANGSLHTRYCFSARARDAVGNLSAWTAERCEVVPYDDATLSAAGSWTRSKVSGWLAGTSSTTTVKGASLTTGTLYARQVGVLALTCPTCGSVSLLLAGKAVGTLSLATSSGSVRRLLLLPRFSTTRSGILRLVVSSNGKTVRVDGLAITGR